MIDLENRAVVLYLTADGFRQLNFLLRLGGERKGLSCLVISSNGFGIWISPVGKARTKLLIVPWHWVRTMELELEAEPVSEVRKSIGFKV